MNRSAVVRRPAVAGRFYSADPTTLRRDVDHLLAGVAADRAVCSAVMVPHAGLMYSGPCAAQVFGRIDCPPLAVIIGPNHTGVRPREGVASISYASGFETPLGVTATGQAFADAVRSRFEGAVPDETAHKDEHAIEVELPFLRRISRETAIVPIVLHTDHWDDCRRLGEALAHAADAVSHPVLLVISSDMTHFESGPSAARKDRLALEALGGLDGKTLLDVCHREGISMCGRGPAAAVVEAVRLRGGARDVSIVDYRNSGWVTGDDRSVVAYAGAIIE